MNCTANNLELHPTHDRQTDREAEGQTDSETDRQPQLGDIEGGGCRYILHISSASFPVKERKFIVIGFYQRGLIFDTLARYHDSM